MTKRLLRFGMIGVWNTIFPYALYALAVYIGAAYYIALLFASIAGVVNNYLTFRAFVFGDRQNASVLRYLLGFAAVYIVSVATTGLFINVGGFNPYLANAMAIPIIAGVSFIVNNLYVFRR